MSTPGSPGSPTQHRSVSTLDGDAVAEWIRRVADAIDGQADQLTALDAAIGDADHGINMRRGFHAVREALPQQAGELPGTILITVGRTLISTVGGASGPLYGTAFRAAGKSLGDAATVESAALLEALRAALAGVKRLGAASEGDKTMVDALSPAVSAFAKAVERGDDLAVALTAAVSAAQRGVTATIPLQARKGRASYLGARSVGHQDPGATSTALILDQLRAVVVDAAGE